MGCTEKKQRSFNGSVMRFTSALRQSMIDKFPRCPMCKGDMDICEVNTQPDNMTGTEHKSMLFCREEIRCGYSSFHFKTVEQYLIGSGINQIFVDVWKYMNEAESRRQVKNKKRCAEKSKELKNGRATKRIRQGDIRL